LSFQGEAEVDNKKGKNRERLINRSRRVLHLGSNIYIQIFRDAIRQTAMHQVTKNIRNMYVLLSEDQPKNALDNTPPLPQKIKKRFYSFLSFTPHTQADTADLIDISLFLCFVQHI
jgi:hypothetical protein